MVELTVKLIKRKYMQHQSHKSFLKDAEKNCLTKITHLFMNEQFICEINNFSICRNLKVIYLQRNFIKKIKNLNFATNLTHLYLQHNDITKIQNLNCLINLKKLYLGYNRIAVIEGLENLSNLSDLHIEKQKLPLDERLVIDPKTANTLSVCLVYLNVSDNHMVSLNGINNFKKLVTLEAQYNLIDNLEELNTTVDTLDALENLFLEGNPVTKIYRYRENVIASSHSLSKLFISYLDQKLVTKNSRDFLKKFKYERLNQSKKKSPFTLSEDITHTLNLPPAFRRSITRAMLHNINPKFSFSDISMIGDSQSQIFPPWKSTLSVKGLKNNRVLPRPFWKHKM
ncbi:PREDICTED: protein phosphatase 1 regulatory subunit 42-like [Ceratosolen solmsi marchali]|uniref:Protein phosphatase 1 regulatory subunit 42-like n=1 Tax=Ceratosolen solmsi marchali TaxID=326594 RepID=A0AAJ6YIC9_9HYME|nr:PREDICTED: protein phosphatase 1 regulatory subunit 42-like [Ceratosolen solmsi marchali]